MKRKFRIWLVATLSIMIIGYLIIIVDIQIQKSMARNLYSKVQHNDRLYIYETYFKSLNPVLYVKNIDDTDLLIKYYRKLEKHDTTAVINFDINFMRLTLHEPIYVYKYLNNSSRIIQMVDFDKNCWGYMKGYVYKPTTHPNPPSDSLIKDEENFIAKFNENKHNNIINRIAKKISAYGWYCDN